MFVLIRLIRYTMEVLGIKFAPLNVPLERRLQTLAAAVWFFTLAAGGVTFSLLFLYMFLYTSYYWFVLLYLAWMWYDRNTCFIGGRRSEWARRWAWWRYFQRYFPLSLVKTTDLDPKRNYLLCVFPHGVLSAGAYASFATEATGFTETFPRMTPHLVTLTGHFMMPIVRELALSLGSCSSSADSMSYLMTHRGGGKAVVLVVGGASESLYCRPGTYSIILKRRKGFIRLALKHGTPLVPVISFGETDLYDQLPNPEGSWLRWAQDIFRKVTGIAPVLMIGRGLFQYSFGCVPLRRPVTTVVGKPLEVEKTAEPTRDQVDELHEKFTNHLVDLFETEKHKYIKNAENISLNIT